MLKHVVHILSLRWGNCKRQLNDGGDNMACIFTSKVWHQGNTVHPLWVSLSTKHQCCKHRVQLSSSHALSAWNTVRTFMHVKRDGRTVSGLSDSSQPRREGSIFQEPKQKCVYIFLTQLPNYILKSTSSGSVYSSTSRFEILCLKWFDYVVKGVAHAPHFILYCICVASLSK